MSATFLSGVRALVTITVCSFVLAFAAPTAHAATIDLNAPASDVHDPVAALAPVDTECHSGQVDLNTASAKDLSEVLQIASAPTVQRIIAARPWLKGADLSSISGVGP